MFADIALCRSRKFLPHPAGHSRVLWSSCWILLFQDHAHRQQHAVCRSGYSRCCTGAPLSHRGLGLQHDRQVQHLPRKRTSGDLFLAGTLDQFTGCCHAVPARVVQPAILLLLLGSWNDRNCRRRCALVAQLERQRRLQLVFRDAAWCHLAFGASSSVHHLAGVELVQQLVMGTRGVQRDAIPIPLLFQRESFLGTSEKAFSRDLAT